MAKGSYVRPNCCTFPSTNATKLQKHGAVRLPFPVAGGSTVPCAAFVQGRAQLMLAEIEEDASLRAVEPNGESHAPAATAAKNVLTRSVKARMCRTHDGVN